MLMDGNGSLGYLSQLVGLCPQLGEKLKVSLDVEGVQIWLEGILQLETRGVFEPGTRPTPHNEKKRTQRGSGRVTRFRG